MNSHINITNGREMTTGELANATNDDVNHKIIRKLGIFETYFHNEIEINSCMNSSTVKFSSNHDVFEHKKIFNKAVKLWKRTQPFLRSRVIQLNENEQSQEQSNSLPGFNKYFAFIEETDEYKKKMDINNEDEYLDNISYLYYKQEDKENSVDDCADFWKMLIEREFTIPIDWKNGPMWRLTIINLNKVKTNQNDLYEYVLLFSMSHSIFDGSSAFACLVSLLTILQYLYDNISNQDSILQHIVDAKVLKPVEECTIDYLKKKNTPYESLAAYKKLDGFKRPSSFVINQEGQRTLSYPVSNLSLLKTKVNSYPNAGFYSAITNKPVIKLSELLELSQEVVTKFRLSKFEGNQFKSFLSKCKSKNTKITGVVNLMFILAWRMTYKKFPCLVQNNENTSNIDPAVLKEKINYLTIVNLRAFLTDIDISSVVWFCNNLNSSFDLEIDISDDRFWQTKFWELARQESQMFHERLKKGEQFKVLETSSPINEDETRLHFGLSNLVVPHDLTREIKLFKINELFTLSSYRKDWTNDFSYNNIISINDKMCWTLSYNSYFIRAEIIDFFRHTVFQIYDRLCDEM